MSKRRSIAVEQLQVSGDECQSDDNALTAPVKRKRGRPNTSGKAAVQKKPVVPRGRGRPRKIKGQGRGRPKKFETVEEPEEVNGYSSVEDVEDDDNKSKANAGNMSPGKGRGRPKKA